MRRMIWMFVLGVGVFAGLVGLRFVTTTPGGGSVVGMAQNSGSFTLDRKNYASQKQQVSAGMALGDSQKYEKIATVSMATRQFEDHRMEIDRIVTQSNGQVQLEELQGLAGRRVLNLGIGIPPDKFDGFIATVRKLARETGLTIVKNDKTNEYLRLRASRASLEKSRSQLESLQAAGGSVDERLKVQTQLSELEGKIQEMSVSLGEFDMQNELCTVKLMLTEERAGVEVSSLRRLHRALIDTIPDFAFLTFGLLSITAALWFAAGLFTFGRKMIRETAA